MADAAAELTACVHPGSGRASAVDSLARASHWQARASPSQAEAPSRTAGPEPPHCQSRVTSRRGSGSHLVALAAAALRAAWQAQH